MHGERRQPRGYVCSDAFEKQEEEKQRAEQSLCAPSIQHKVHASAQHSSPVVRVGSHGLTLHKATIVPKGLTVLMWGHSRKRRQ